MFSRSSEILNKSISLRKKSCCRTKEPNSVWFTHWSRKRGDKWINKWFLEWTEINEKRETLVLLRPFWDGSSEGPSPFSLVLYIASETPWEFTTNLNRILHFALRIFTNSTKDSAISSSPKTGKRVKKAWRETAVTEDLSEFCQRQKNLYRSRVSSGPDCADCIQCDGKRAKVVKTGRGEAGWGKGTGIIEY